MEDKDAMAEAISQVNALFFLQSHLVPLFSKYRMIVIFIY